MPRVVGGVVLSLVDWSPQPPADYDAYLKVIQETSLASLVRKTVRAWF